MLKMIKLLIKYNIIKLDYVFQPDDMWGQYIWDRVRILPLDLKGKEYSKYLMDELADLFVAVWINNIQRMRLLLRYFLRRHNIGILVVGLI